MLLRIRWFMLGVVSTLASTAYVVVNLRRLRARMTPDNVRRASALAAADVLGLAARAVAPDQPARRRTAGRH
jgi:hypothetical protein